MRRGPLAGILLAGLALAACLVAVLWRGDKAGRDLAVSGAPAELVVTDIRVPGPSAGGDVSAAINRTGSIEVPVRRYDPAPNAAGDSTQPWAVLVWAHGGSFVRGGLDMPEADWAARQFAAAGIRVYSVDYVLVSDTVKAPAPANDVAAVAHFVAKHETAPLIIGGASAGAHLATLATLDLAESAQAGTSLAAQALLLEYPTLHRVQRPDAQIARATAGLDERLRFDPDRISQMYTTYLGEPADAAGRVAGELGRDQLALLPETVIVNADADELRASGEQFAEQLAMAGVRVIEYTQAGTTHGYLNRPEESEEARKSAQQTIARFVAGARAALDATT